MPPLSVLTLSLPSLSCSFCPIIMCLRIMLRQLIPTLSWYMAIYKYRWIYKQHFRGHLSRLSFNRLNPSPVLVHLNGRSQASHTASRKPSPVSSNAMQALSFYFSLNGLIPKPNHRPTSSEMIVVCMFYLPELS